MTRLEVVKQRAVLARPGIVNVGTARHQEFSAGRFAKCTPAQPCTHALEQLVVTVVDGISL